jgi:hypothetical protein
VLGLRQDREIIAVLNEFQWERRHKLPGDAVRMAIAYRIAIPLVPIELRSNYGFRQVRQLTIGRIDDNGASSRNLIGGLVLLNVKCSRDRRRSPDSLHVGAPIGQPWR